MNWADLANLLPPAPHPGNGGAPAMAAAFWAGDANVESSWGNWWGCPMLPEGMSVAGRAEQGTVAGAKSGPAQPPSPTSTVQLSSST